MKSKIIQIAAYQTQYRRDEFPQDMVYNNHIIALCEDGTLWERTNCNPWKQIPTKPKG